MSKSIKIYISVLVLIFILILVSDYNKPKPIDWRPTYSVNDKIPFGLYVFDKEIGGIFKKQKIQRISNVTPYEFLDSKYDEDSLVETYTVKGTFVNVSAQNNIDDQSMKEIMYFVSHGNNAFLSMVNFPQPLLDSLKIAYTSNFHPMDSSYVWMANKNLSKKAYKSTSEIVDYFTKFDTLNTTVLGYHGNPKKKKNVNFIKVPYKNGNFFLHIHPVAFTNYNMLKKDRYEYAENVLSYIPKGDIFWYTKLETDENVSRSPLRYIMSQPALKWAWYLFIIGMLIFMIFNAKRKQRIVPILEPLPNLTVDFTKTIGNLYYQEGDHTNIIDKKIIYFLEKIRTEYLIDTTKLDDVFVTKLHHKTGKNEKDIQELIFLINEHRNSYHDSIEEDLIRINNAIEKILH
ncbi:DUF4350 domain-containing protein [Flavobacterium defluvii]|uniref:DUF4350 domain-containing protein n=1 Tax=Flavobacterium defluvii TaxID=370979 RepID=A0A1M5R748_9FLAO|nr:DUF4350 domain-containing protein [Flavobacterium defluvii]SHH21683.1 protein of unknown function [Flavobacterium defluvii]